MQRQERSQWKGDAIDLVIIIMMMKFITMASCINIWRKGWLAIAKLMPLSLFISLLLMPNEAFDNAKIEK